MILLGPDNTWKGSLSNIIQYGRLWKTLQIQLLVVTGYHSLDSAFNPVERAMASATFDITGAIFSDENESGKKVSLIM